MKASDLFVKCLEAEGVDYIFGPIIARLPIMPPIIPNSIIFFSTK